MPKRKVQASKGKPKRKCQYCKLILEYTFCNDGWSCFTCKVTLCQQKMLATTNMDSWLDCNNLGKYHFVKNLQTILHVCHLNKSIKICGELFGSTLYETEKLKFIRLFEFAQKEEDEYRFSPIEFVCCRMERELDTQCLDFWLTLCCIFDVGNYADDYITMCKSQFCGIKLN